MPLALLALAIACLSQPANLVRFAGAPVEALGFWRLTLAAAVLAPVAWRRRAAWKALSSREKELTAAAGSLFFIHLWTFTYAAQHTSIAACMIGFSTHPVWTGAAAWLLLGEALTPRLLLAYSLAGAGVWGLFSGAAAAGRGTLLGNASAVLSAVAFSGYVLCGRRARRTVDNASFAAAAYALAAALFFAVGSARGVAWLSYPSSTWAAIAGLAFGVTLGGHALFTHLLATMDVNVLSCAKLLEPPLAAVGARLAFGETLTLRTAWAFALVAAAVLVLLLPGGRSSVEPAALED
jgi:drug/metabolite transporter (DMT)-like permease